MEQKLQQILNKSIDNKKVFGTSFCIQYKDFSWCGASGNLKTDSQYYIASTTKLFVTAIILNFKKKGLLQLDDTIEKFLEPHVIRGLHVLNGKDYSSTITIRNLLAHTSGIPDYFQQKDSAGNSMESEIIKGNDQCWDFEKVIAYSKRLRPLFIPGTKGKALYSDTNFQLLGKIIEQISGKTIDQNYGELIFEPLGLTQTYLYRDIEDKRPLHLYYKNRELHIPKAMSSFGPDGGIVSTSKEMMSFLHSFFNGLFFPKEYIPKLQQWNRIFFPMRAGVGIHLFRLPWIFNPLGTMPDLIGHSGLSGALAYYSEKKDLYITGTVNQVAYPDTSFRLTIKLIQQLR